LELTRHELAGWIHSCRKLMYVEGGATRSIYDGETNRYYFGGG